MRQDLDAGRLLGAIGQRHGHLTVSERFRRVRPERQFRPEHSLALETRALSDVQMIVVALQGLLVHVEYLGAEVQGHTAVGPFDEARVALLFHFAVLVKGLSPSGR